MSTETVTTIIGRAVVEPEFRELLFGSPDEALAGYDLSGEEAAALKAMERETFDSAAGELEERISKSGLMVGSGIGPVEQAGVEMSGQDVSRRFLERFLTSTASLDGKGND